MIGSWFRRVHPISALAPRSGRAVVLTRGGGSKTARRLRADRPNLDVVEVAVAKKAFARIAGLRPVELIVDDAGSGGKSFTRFRRHFLLLAENGRYVGPRPMEALVVSLTTEHQNRKADRALAAAVGRVEVGAAGVVLTRVGRTVVKMREAETTTALMADPTRGRVLEGIAAATFASRCEFREMLPLTAVARKPYIEAPSAVLREYYWADCAPLSLVVQRGLVLVDSFRHHPQKRLNHGLLVDVDRRHAKEPSWLGGVLPTLEGAWYHLDNESRGHFGHALTEQVARMWAWDEALRLDPDVRVLVAVRKKRRTLAVWEYALFEAAGIPEERITVIDRPVRVERLLAATSLFSMPFYVHPDITETWDRIGRNLRAQAPRREYPRRIFCSRKIERRACHNARDVEALFARHNFEVIYPEDYPLAEQAAIFHEADVVAGFAGSGLFTVMFSDRPKHVIVVASETYTQRNEYLISAVRGHRLDMAYSPEDRTDPMYHIKRHRCSFTFDFSREGQWLQDEVFAHLAS